LPLGFGVQLQAKYKQRKRQSPWVRKSTFSNPQ
jgi:hypothetical protein